MLYVLVYMVVGMMFAGYKIPKGTKKSIKEKLTEEEYQLHKNEKTHELSDEKKQEVVIIWAAALIGFFLWILAWPMMLVIKMTMKK